MRLIDAEALETKIKKIEAEALEHGFAPEYVAVDILLDFLNGAPTIEAKPVIYAHWNEHREFYEDEGFEGYYYSCSNCGGTLYGDLENFNFCQHCGAQMDENHIAGSGKKEPICGATNLPCSECMPCCESRKKNDNG